MTHTVQANICGRRIIAIVFVCCRFTILSGTMLGVALPMHNIVSCGLAPTYELSQMMSASTLCARWYNVFIMAMCLMVHVIDELFVYMYLNSVRIFDGKIVCRMRAYGYLLRLSLWRASFLNAYVRVHLHVLKKRLNSLRVDIC